MKEIESKKKKKKKKKKHKIFILIWGDLNPGPLYHSKLFFFISMHFTFRQFWVEWDTLFSKHVMGINKVSGFEHKVRGSKATKNWSASAKPEGSKQAHSQREGSKATERWELKMQSLRKRSNWECESKAQSPEKQSDRVTLVELTWARWRNA